MHAGARSSGAVLTLAALLFPWAAGFALTIHLLSHDHHPRHPFADDRHRDADVAALILHGHGHEPGTPEHEHSSILPISDSLLTRESTPHATKSDRMAALPKDRSAARRLPCFLPGSEGAVFGPSPPVTRIPCHLRI